MSPRKHRKAGLPLWQIIAIAAVVLIAAVFILPGMLRKPGTLCADLPANELFDKNYPSFSSITSNSVFTQPDFSDAMERYWKIMATLRTHGGSANKAVGQWYDQNKPNIVLYDDLIRGAGMATIWRTKEKTPELAVSLILMNEGDNAKAAIVFGHEAIHYQDLLNDPTLNNALCEEMRAYAWEVVLYAEFRERGFRQPNYESELNLLRSLWWDWRTEAWQAKVTKLLNGDYSD